MPPQPRRPQKPQPKPKQKPWHEYPDYEKRRLVARWRRWSYTSSAARWFSQHGVDIVRTVGVITWKWRLNAQQAAALLKRWWQHVLYGEWKRHLEGDALWKEITQLAARLKRALFPPGVSRSMAPHNSTRSEPARDSPQHKDSPPHQSPQPKQPTSAAWRLIRGQVVLVSLMQKPTPELLPQRESSGL